MAAILIYKHVGQDATRRGLGIDKIAKQASKLPNKFRYKFFCKSSSQTLSPQKQVAALSGPQIYVLGGWPSAMEVSLSQLLTVIKKQVQRGVKEQFTLCPDF